MLRTLMMASAAAMLLTACGQGPAEEAGEATDTAVEESTTGTTDLGQGPAEEAGEAIDDATNDGTAPGATTTPPTP